MGDLRHERKRGKGKLKAVLHRDGSFCHWCERKILLQEELDRRKRSGENVSEFRAATLDHLVPVAYSGAEDMRNYVASCADCNIERARRKIMQDKKDEQDIRGKVIRPDPVKYVEKLPWRMFPDVPNIPCLVLLTHPTHWVIRLATVGLQNGHPVLVGKAGILDFPDVWWCPIDDLLSRIDTYGDKG